MYTKATKSTTRTKVETPQREIVSNPIHSDFPNQNINYEQYNIRHQLINNIMFFGLAAVAITIFYKALMSLML